jgi:hypothetical protein
MKALTATLILLCACSLGQAQAPDTNRILYVTTSSNFVSISNAAKMASGLHVGMPGEEVQKYMQKHGMIQTNIYCISVDRGRTLTCPYQLAGGTTLMLDMHCTNAPPTGLFGWSAPILDRARIQSQGADIMSITLTNAP